LQLQLHPDHSSRSSSSPEPSDGLMGPTHGHCQ
jgi:hypothetical protein